MKYTTRVTTKHNEERVDTQMEWMNRGGEQPAANQPAHGGSQKKKKFDGMNMRIVSVALLFGLTIIAVGVIWLLAMGGSSSSNESKYVEGDRLQAVFLNGGQVYFGNITTLNDDYLRMNNIYYLRVNQVVQPNQRNADGTPATQNDISLVKLGCELHGPKDEMLINRDQVIFWENLKEDGQVAEAVKDYVAQNPDGQDCNAQQGQQTTPSGNTNENN